MSYNYGNTQLVITPTSGSWAAETWTLNQSLTTSDYVFYDATVHANVPHLPSRIAIKYSAGSTANAQLWESATYSNAANNAGGTYLVISSSTGGSGSSTATYTGPNGSPSNVVTFNKVLIDVTQSNMGLNSLNSGTATQNMDGSLSFIVSPGSSSSETYSISLSGVDQASIVPSGVAPWYKNYTFLEHTSIGYGEWILYDQNGPLATITTTDPATPATPATPAAPATEETVRRVFCNFW